jgi:heme exporter protein C
VSTTLRFFRFASPAAFYPLAGKLVPWFTAIAAILAATGLYLGMLRAPTDATQGDSYRIIFIHVPAAWMSMLLYVVMAFWAAIGWAFNARLASIVARAIAPTGAMFTFLALWTGALWGKPTWGAWWVWDARLTSELILLFLYLGYMALRSSFDDRERADRASAVLAIVGVINIPIIHYSVEWWTTLHQPASVTRLAKPAIALPMLVPLFIMLAGYQLYFGWLLCRRLQGEILRRERSAGWLKEVG